jgi:ATP/maltotriose-dependent transcriptional regulator MalT
LGLSAYYEEAYEQGSRMLEDATEFRVGPVLPSAHTLCAMSLAGLGNYAEARSHLDAAQQGAVRCNDEFAVQMVYAMRLRVLIQDGRAPEACALEPPDLEHALQWVRSEVLAARGLALATVGRLAEAIAMADEARRASNLVDARILAAAIDAVCAIKRRDRNLRDTIKNLVDTAFAAGAVDPLVIAYRGNAELLDALLSSSATREQTWHVAVRAGDEMLARAAGFDPISTASPVDSLSRREREIYQLLCDGLSNGEIAERLFITEGTVKVHVHHVFDKLGVRSRTALAISAVRQRSQQAPDMPA